MKKFFPALGLLASALIFTGCNDDNDHNSSEEIEQPQATLNYNVNIPSLTEGQYRVALNNPENDSVQVGWYSISADQQAVLLIDDLESSQATAAYVKDSANALWASVSSLNQNTTLTFENTELLATELLTLSDLKGSYVSLINQQETVKFKLDETGKIQPADSACQLSGQVSKSSMPNSFAYKIQTQGCLNLAPEFSGYLVHDAEHAPAAFRLIQIDQKQPVLSLQAYQED